MHLFTLYTYVHIFDYVYVPIIEPSEYRHLCLVFAFHIPVQLYGSLGACKTRINIKTK